MRNSLPISYTLRCRRLSSASTTSDDCDGSQRINKNVVAAQTRTWVKDFVFKLGLCPWSGLSLTGNNLKISVLKDASIDEDAGIGDICQAIIDEANNMLDFELNDNATIQAHSTTLIVLPSLAKNTFEEFLGLVDIVQNLIEDVELDDYIQLATFHPEYRFEGAESEEENFTNRSPYPTIHLLKVSEVSDAIKQYTRQQKKAAPASTKPEESGDKVESDDEQIMSEIWERNINLMRKIGLKKLVQLNDKILKNK